MEQRMVSLKCQKWVMKLMGYDFEIQYRPELEIEQPMLSHAFLLLSP